jgi:hypothetical protein
MAEVAKALGDPVRVQLVDVLRRHAGKVCVCELVPLFDICGCATATDRFAPPASLSQIGGITPSHGDGIPSHMNGTPQRFLRRLTDVRRPISVT